MVTPFMGVSMYSIAKLYLQVLTRPGGSGYPDGVYVNCVSPGGSLYTDFMTREIPDKKAAKRRSRARPDGEMTNAVSGGGRLLRLRPNAISWDRS